MKKFNIASLMLATALVLSACGNTADKEADKKEDTKVEESAENKDEMATDKKEEADKEEEKVEEVKPENAEQAEGNVILHRGYPKSEGARSFPRIVVATSGDKILGVSIDEYQYAGDDKGYEAVANSDKGFGEGTAEGKVLISKMDNEEKYSSEMKEAGSPTSLKETYEGISEFVKGKTIEEVETFLKDKSEDEIIEAVTGATFKSTPALLNYVTAVARDNQFVSVGHAENPEDITFKAVTGAPHGEKSFADCVLAMEGDKIIAASFDEFQYMEDAEGITNAEDDFTQGYADSNKALVSKLENNDKYSALMTEKAQSTVSIKDNFEAIEKFVAGKTASEIEEAIAAKNEDGTIDSVTGATLKDTANYLQLIVDAAKK
ncbi:peptidoglycan-binding protein [Anaerococcus sp.]|uniref:peptidoglycan-binding protein n=1 Tax=Anaerococcus sp. TaxID=1872515 RepID=UPI002A755CE3|nr:peptidoglycan-binding protein [Anaerococcus sp.]MDD6918143.1 peptidoglycan-binding protein [Peptoniphilaceae bacterium]MDY2928483.1 peptidoglycan-binding protein [Anaerococcus sp.]